MLIGLLWLNVVPLIAGVQLCGLIAALVLGFPIYREAFSAILARRMTMGLSMGLMEEGIVDRFYMVKDKFLGLAGGLSCGTTASPATCTHADLVDVTSNQLQGGTLPADKQG